MATKRKIGIIVGTRPQFVKLFPMITELDNRKEALDYFVIHTGQHFSNNMSDDFISSLNLPEPKFNLNIHSLPDGKLLGETIDGISTILNTEKPDLIVVMGDSHSTLAGAMASKYNGIACAHIEAGLRSYNLSMPEEMNRVMVDNISDLLFTPTTNATQNLKFLSQEKSIIQCGDIMLDIYNIVKPAPLKVDLGDYILFTTHRRKLMNDKNSLLSIIHSMNEIDRDVCKVIAPLHPNCINKMKEYEIYPNFIIIPPQPYSDMRSLIDHSQLVITDSGGLQKEAYFSSKYCITIREETEWVETLHDGCNTLVGNDTNLLKDTITHKLNLGSCAADVSQFGNGTAAIKIVEEISNYPLK